MSDSSNWKSFARLLWILVEILQTSQNLGDVVARLGVKNNMRNIDFANVHLGVLDNSHRLPPKTRLFVLFGNSNCNAFGLPVTVFQKKRRLFPLPD
jgi:hypothetical protein